MKNLILNVGLASADGIPYGTAMAAAAVDHLLWTLENLGVPAPNITARGEGQYTADNGVTYREPCLSLTWYGTDHMDTVKQAASVWCRQHEQESYALQIAEVTIIPAGGA